MSCNHLCDCIRCANVVDAEREIGFREGFAAGAGEQFVDDFPDCGGPLPKSVDLCWKIYEARRMKEEG